MNAQERYSAEKYEISPLRLKPIISYPRQAEIGKTYLMSIDVQLERENGKSDWPYPEEEYPISFILNVQPYFTYQPLGEQEPTIVLHRFGGTYGPAEYRLTAADHEIGPGRINITFVNGWGLPITHLNLSCEVKRVVQADPTRQILLVPRLPIVPTPLHPQPEPITHPIRKAVYSETQALKPELQQAVELVKTQLLQAGWSVQRESNIDWEDNSGIAVRDFPFSTDDVPTFMLYVDRSSLGMVDVRIIDPTTLSSSPTRPYPGQGDVGQGRTDLVSGVLPQLLPFVYESDGHQTRFTSMLEPEGVHNRPIFTFHRPETLKRWATELLPHTQPTENSFRARLRHLPEQPIESVDTPVREALMSIERALSEGQARVLLRVAADYDVSLLAIPGIYRLLQYAGAQHILYITSAESERSQTIEYIRAQFERYPVPDAAKSMRRFYKIGKLEGSSSLPLDPENNVSIATIQQLASLLHTDKGQTQYRQDMPIESFDVVFVDDARLVVDSAYRRVLEYFDAPLISFTAAEEPLSFFGNTAIYTLQLKLRPATVILGLLDDSEQNKRNSIFIQQKLLTRGIRATTRRIAATPANTIANLIGQSSEEADAILLFTDGYTSSLSEVPMDNTSSDSKIVCISLDTNKSMEEIITLWSVHGTFEEAGLLKIIEDVIQKALSHHQKALEPKSPPEIGILFHTFPPTPPVGEHSLDIDWTAHFINTLNTVSTQNISNAWPSASLWQQEFLPALRDIRTVLQSLSLTTLRCYLNARMSAAFLFGFTFAREAGFTLLLIDHSDTWSTNASRINHSLIRSHLETREVLMDNIVSEGVEVEEEYHAVIDISISNQVTDDVTAYIRRYHLPWQCRLHISGRQELIERESRDQGANWALTLAWQIRRAIEGLCKQQPVTHIHLFCSMSHRLAVLLGHYISGLQVSLTFYDFDTDIRFYRETFVIDV